jgi:ribonuclease P protein component
MSLWTHQSFDTPPDSYHNPPADAPQRFRAPGAFACFIGVSWPRGQMERNSPSHEADLSAQEATSQQRTRLPRPDEDYRGPPSARLTSPPRPKEAHGLTSDRGHNSPRLVMLSRPEDFAALQGEGTVRSHPLLVVRIRRTGLEDTRFGLSTGRKLGGAVVRNRVRRRLRQALRVMTPSLQPGWDVLIVARSPAIDADFQALADALQNLLRRGGVLGGRTVT